MLRTEKVALTWPLNGIYTSYGDFNAVLISVKHVKIINNKHHYPLS